VKVQVHQGVLRHSHHPSQVASRRHVLHCLACQVNNPRHSHQGQGGLRLSHLLGQLHRVNHRPSQASSPAFMLRSRQAYLQSHLRSHRVNPLRNHLATLLWSPHPSHHLCHRRHPSPRLDLHLIPVASPAVSLLRNQAGIRQ